jgi:hypothetical protein
MFVHSHPHLLFTSNPTLCHIPGLLCRYYVLAISSRFGLHLGSTKFDIQKKKCIIIRLIACIILSVYITCNKYILIIIGKIYKSVLIHNRSCLWHIVAKWISNVVYVSTNKHLISMKNCFVIYFGCAREMVKRRFLISNVSAGNITHCREQHVAQELQIERVCHMPWAVDSVVQRIVIPVTRAWHFLRSRVDEWPSDLERTCEYIEWAVEYRWQGVVLQLEGWARC